jgi:hypothetical protein
MLVLGCGWVTSLAQQPRPASTVQPPSAVLATGAPESTATGTAAERDSTPADAGWRRGTDESALSAVAIKLASNDAGPAAAAAPAPPVSTDAPRDWVLLGAGVWLILAVSRRRKRTPAH